MKIKLLGKSGLRVSELCLGTMTFGEDWGWGASEKESRKIFDLYAEAGGNFLDTANIYTNGQSEKIVGELVRKERARWVVATKYSMNNQSSDVNMSGNHRKNLVQSLEGSLKRLKVDYVDILWLHAWDYTTPIEEVMRSLDDLVRAGKVLYVGISDAPAWVVSSANTLAALRGWSPFIGLQIEYSLIERTPERDLLPMAKEFNLAVTPWGPLGGGILTGKYNHPKKGEPHRYTGESSRPAKEDLEIAQVVVDIAKKIGKTPSQVALNWLLQQGSQVIPILGARTAAQIEDNLGCLSFTLSPEHLKKLDEVSTIPLGFPGEFFQSNTLQNFAFGGSLRKIEYGKSFS